MRIYSHVPTHGGRPTKSSLSYTTRRIFFRCWTTSTIAAINLRHTPSLYSTRSPGRFSLQTWVHVYCIITCMCGSFRCWKLVSRSTPTTTAKAWAPPPAKQPSYLTVMSFRKGTLVRRTSSRLICPGAFQTLIKISLTNSSKRLYYQTTTVMTRMICSTSCVSVSTVIQRCTVSLEVIQSYASTSSRIRASSTSHSAQAQLSDTSYGKWPSRSTSTTSSNG